MLYTSP